MQRHAPTQKELVRGPEVFFCLKVMGDYWNRLLEEYQYCRACGARAGRKAGRSTSARICVKKDIILALAPVKRLSRAFQWKAGNTQQKDWTLYQREWLVKTDKGIYHV
jgi:hypothetical protein